MKWYFFFIVVVLICSAMVSSFAQEKKVKFKYCRVEILRIDSGYVAHTDGVIIFEENLITMKSNNEEPDAIFSIAKEVAPEREGHKAWLVFNAKVPNVPLVLELGEGDGVKLSLVGTKEQAFYFAKEREDELQKLPEENVWFAFPLNGGELREID